MSDLSQPPLSLIPAEATLLAWPTPRLPGYPDATPIEDEPPCAIEGLNGRVIEGRLDLFDTARGLLQVRMEGVRKPLSLHLDQFRRMRLLAPLHPVAASDARDLASERPQLPFSIDFKGAPAWHGTTLTHHEDASGLFLFEPESAADAAAPDHGAVRRWFVPRAAFERARIGPLLGEALVRQNSVSPDALQAALGEQSALRDRKLGDLMVVRQLIRPEDLVAALQHQARMPTMRIGEALKALGLISAAQLDETLAQQRGDRGVPLGELLLRKGLVTRIDLQTALARKMGYPMVDVLQFQADADALARVPQAVASREQALPLMMRAARLVVAVEDPGDQRRIDAIERAAGCKAVPVLAAAGTLAAAIEAAYARLGTVPAAPIAARAGADEALMRRLHALLVDARARGIGDIHIDCPAGPGPVRIRWQRDGITACWPT